MSYTDDNSECLAVAQYGGHGDANNKALNCVAGGGNNLHSGVALRFFGGRWQFFHGAWHNCTSPMTILAQ